MTSEGWVYLIFGAIGWGILWLPFQLYALAIIWWARVPRAKPVDWLPLRGKWLRLLLTGIVLLVPWAALVYSVIAGH